MCENMPQFDMMPKEDNNMDVESFIENFKHLIDPEQLKLLQIYNETIRGLSLQSLSTNGPEMRLRELHTAVFIFQNVGIRGSIEFKF